MGLEAIAIGLIVGGAIYGGVSAYQQGQTEAGIANYDAAVKEQQARAREQKAAFEQNRQAKKAAREMSSLQAGMGAAGLITTIGTPLAIAAEQASELELENLMIGYEGAVGASQAKSEAAGYRMAGGLARQRGQAGLIGGLLGAGGTLLYGFGEGYFGKKGSEWQRFTVSPERAGGGTFIH